MTVIFKRRTSVEPLAETITVVAEKVQVPVDTVLQKIPQLTQSSSPKVDKPLLKGRDYRHNRSNFNSPKKTLEQTLPKRYNTNNQQGDQRFRKDVPDTAVTEYRGYRCNACRDSGKVVVFDICDACYGEGCRECNNGEVKNYIPCQECKKGKH